MATTRTRPRERLSRISLPAKGQADYNRGNGLWLRVFASGKMVFFIRGRVRGSGAPPLFIRLGEAGALTEDEARIAAAKAREQLLHGINPNQQRAEEIRDRSAASRTVGDLIAEYLADPQVAAKLRPKTLKNRAAWLNSTKLEGLRRKPIGAVTAQDIEKYRPANRNSESTYLAPLNTLMSYAKKIGYLSDTVRVSVARAEGNASPMVRFSEGQKPDFTELLDFLNCLDALEAQNPINVWPAIYRFGLYTGARISEIAGVDWSEVDLAPEAAKWTLPASRSKIHRECERPLSEAAATVLRAERPKKSGLVWPSPRTGKPRNTASDEARAISTMMITRGHRDGFRYGRLRDTVASYLEMQPDATERSIAMLQNWSPPAQTTRLRHYTRISADHKARELIERWSSAVREARLAAVMS